VKVRVRGTLVMREPAGVFLILNGSVNGTYYVYVRGALFCQQEFFVLWSLFRPDSALIRRFNTRFLLAGPSGQGFRIMGMVNGSGGDLGHTLLVSARRVTD
jgi:hypothetical protein